MKYKEILEEFLAWIFAIGAFLLFCIFASAIVVAIQTVVFNN